MNLKAEFAQVQCMMSLIAANVVNGEGWKYAFAAFSILAGVASIAYRFSKEKNP